MKYDKKKMSILRPKFIFRIIYRIIKLIIPVFIYLKRSIKNPELIRFAIPWIYSNIDPNRNAIKDEAPWITFQARKCLEEFLCLNKNMIVFEYGSGGTTLFFSKRVKRLISVEHDRNWYLYINSLLQQKNILNCEYLLCEAYFVPDGNLDIANPQSYASAEYDRMSFETYVKTIDAFPDKSFDLIFIDGRARSSCILHARNKVKLGGFLMLDNSERNYYSPGKELLIDWEQKHFFGPGPYGRYFWQTSTWRRPRLSK